IAVHVADEPHRAAVEPLADRDLLILVSLDDRLEHDALAQGLPRRLVDAAYGRADLVVAVPFDVLEQEVDEPAVRLARRAAAGIRELLMRPLLSHGPGPASARSPAQRAPVPFP